MLHLPRVMFAAPSSGSGKTMITCGILEALMQRGRHPVSFKCGPDYIDPMFHTKVIGTPSRNLDTFFTDRETTRYLFAKTARTAGVSILEGVMGLYDGLGGISEKASSYDLACVTDTPIVLIVNARGMSLSVIPLIQGYLDYQKRFGREIIRGVILNQTTKMTYLLLKEEIEKQTGVHAYGYVPRLDDAAVESRHLGLVTPGEIEDLRVRLARLGKALEQSLELDGILSLAEEAGDYEDWEASVPDQIRDSGNGDITWSETSESVKMVQSEAFQVDAQHGFNVQRRVRIAVARDEAFCFYYQDNLELLEQLGAELIPFSPLHDQTLPENIGGLLLGGGYPELYAGELSENTAMKTAIRAAIESGIPYLAECGGFMYLHETMEDMEGKTWPMCGCIRGNAFRTEKLGRFGYITLTPRQEEARQKETIRLTEPGGEKTSAQLQGENLNALSTGLLCPGETIRAHEFHYFDSTDPGNGFVAKKPAGTRSWECAHVTDHSVAGYPHLYYWSNPAFAARFIEKCRIIAGLSGALRKTETYRKEKDLWKKKESIS